MKQLLNRHCLLHVRRVLELFNGGQMKTTQAMAELGVSRTTLFELRKQWLDAKRKGVPWTLGISGGNHQEPWPDDAVAFLRRVLAKPNPYSYAFAASEMQHHHGFHADRAQVRRWAVQNNMAHGEPQKREPAHWRRFQRTSIGELWQLDAAPHAYFGDKHPQFHMLNMLDDCSRFQVGGAVYARETLAAYIHFLKAAFEAHGLPLLLYVDLAAFFKSPNENGTTRLKNRLAFYEVSLLYAHSPEAKGKIERLHQIWQDRLPRYFAKNGPPGSLQDANTRHIAPLIDWRNHHEVHRETGMIAAEAWTRALAEGRSQLRPRPPCPWWDYIWSEMAWVKVLPRQRVRIGLEDVPVSTAVGERVLLCSHTDGTHTVLRDLPRKGQFPVVLHEGRPRPNEPLSPPTVRF